MSIKQLDIMDYISTQTMIHGDCLEEMRKMADNSIDFIVCDPPYGLNFMGKKWDDNVPNINIWTEALRISKPGSMLAAFGGSRTHHHLMLALEQSGWEIRDVIMWIYGSGFPKSHNKFGLDGYGTALKPAYEPIIIAMKPLEGTYKQNAEKWGVAGINIDDCRIESNGEHKKTEQFRKTDSFLSESKGMYTPGRSFKPNNSDLGRWPANIILDEESAEQLDEMTGVSKSRSGGFSGDDPGMWAGKNKTERIGHDDSDGVSRFFYVAKASSAERNKGLDGMPDKPSSCNLRQQVGLSKSSKEFKIKNTHPTIKPISLMKYILKLLAPPGNPICLDPFAGSGSTLLAAKELGINCIGIEKELEYFEIAQQRIKNG